MFNQLNDVQKNRLFNVVFAALILLCVFLGAASLNAFKQNDYIGRGDYPANTISVNGTGDVYAVPDTSLIYFSVTEEAKTASVAQDNAAKKTNAIIAAIKALGIEEKDIQTTNYSSYPKYEYSNSVCPQPMPPVIMESSGNSSGGTVSASAMPYYCPPGKSTLTGYEVSENITVKIRKTADVGAVLTKIGELGATNISGPSYSVEDTDAVQAQARDKAIQDAKVKASVLAKSLGVHLSRIVSFQESNGGPIFYAMDKAMAMGAQSVPAPTRPELPVGQNKVTSNVTIIYEVN